MRFSLFIIATLLFVGGIGYLYFPDLVLKVNRWFREAIFAEKHILLYRRRLGVIYFLLSLAIFYTAFNIKFENINLWLAKQSKIRLYRIYQYYNLKQYDRALDECNSLLAEEPNNIRVLEQMGLIYIVKKEDRLAEGIWKRILKLEPKNKLANKYYKK